VTQFVDVTGVHVLGGYVLELTFSTGEVRVLDVAPYLWGPVFEPLRDPAVFAQVIVDPEAGTIAWPATGADLSPEELYARSTPADRTGRQPRPGAVQAQRLAAHRSRLLATGWLTVAELAARRGDADVAATGAWLATRLLARELIVVTGPDGNLVVPAFQLTEAGDPRPELGPLLSALRAAGIGGWAAWTWLTSPSSLLSGDLPEQVAISDPARAVRVAARFAAGQSA
jgi:Protein of unknown function (DUF2442)